MDNLTNRIESLTKLNGLELAFKYIYDNNIPLDKIDYKSEIIKNFFRIDERKFKMTYMVKMFQGLITHILESSYIPDSVLIPGDKKIYVKQWPRFMPNTPHYHKNVLEISCLLKGNIHQFINGIDIEMHAGDICLIAPNAEHHSFIIDENVILLPILVYQEELKDTLNEIGSDAGIVFDFISKILYSRDFLPFILCPGVIDPLISHLLLDMLDIQDTGSKFETKFIKSGIDLIFLKIMNSSHNIISSGPIFKNNVSISMILEYAAANYSSITLTELARKYNYSSGYLSSVIKSCFGMSFKDIIIDIKLNKAAEYLEKTNLSVYEISEKIGYSDKSYFFRAFKKRFHLTPAEYRKLKVNPHTSPADNPNSHYLY